MTPEVKSLLLSLFVEYALPLLLTGLASAASWALMQLGKAMAAKGAESKLGLTVSRVAHLADVVVHDLEATIKPELLKATADGVLTKAEISQLRLVALTRLKALMAEHGVMEVKGVLGIVAPNIDTYLTGVIERAVAKMPEAQAAKPSP